MADLPIPDQGILLTHFVVSADVERSRRFYTDVLGGETVRAGEPVLGAIRFRGAADSSFREAKPSAGLEPATPSLPYNADMLRAVVARCQSACIRASFGSWLTTTDNC